MTGGAQSCSASFFILRIGSLTANGFCIAPRIRGFDPIIPSLRPGSPGACALKILNRAWIFPAETRSFKYSTGLLPAGEGFRSSPNEIRRFKG